MCSLGRKAALSLKAWEYGELMIQVPELQGLKTRSSNIQGQEKKDVQGEIQEFALPCVLVQSGPAAGQVTSTHVDEGRYLYSAH